MAYSETLAKRIAQVLKDLDVACEEKKMFGGVAFMIQDKMCVGVVKEDLMLRVMDEKFEKVLTLEFARPMDFTGKRMKGFLFVGEQGIEKDSELKKWVELGVEFGLKGMLKTKKK